MKTFIETGRIVSTHGVRGEVKVKPWCDEPEFLTTFDTLYLGDPERMRGAQERRIESARVHKSMVLIKFEGVDTPEAGAALRGTVLYIHRDRIPLEPGEHLIQDLCGLHVFDADTGAEYGVLTDVSFTGANDVYHVRFPDGIERLIPKIPQVVLRVDIAAGRMEIRPLEGLFD